MRAAIALLVLGMSACGNGEDAGAEAARRQAEQDRKAQATQSAPARRMTTPVPDRRTCRARS